MPVLPFAEWVPDQPAGTGSTATRNVIARTKGSYGPMPSPMVSTEPLPERAFGSLTLMDPSRQVWMFVATQTKLMRFFRDTAGDWVDVSKAGGYDTLSYDDGGAWSAAAFGDVVIFTNYIDPPQFFNIRTGGTGLFADLSADAPKAKYVAVIKDFVFLGSTNDPVDGERPRRLWWSSIGDPHDWPTPGSDLAIMRQSDFQDLESSEMGHLRGIVGGNLSGADGGAIFERGCIRIAYVGSPAIWSFAVSEGVAGCVAPWSIVSRRMPSPSGMRSVAYWYSDDGFLAWDGAAAQSIGAQRIDRFVYEDMLPPRRQQIAGVSVPYANLVLWAYHGAGTSSSLYNRLLVYNWALDRWTLCELEPFEWLQANISSSLSIDDLDPYGPLDDFVTSLDSMSWVTSKPDVGVFDAEHRFAQFTGPPLGPTVETAEGGLPGRRTKLHGTARPLIEGNGAPATIAAGYREQQWQAVTYGVNVPVSILGNCGLRSTGRYVRLRLQLPAGTAFSHLSGIEVSPQPEGRLR